MTDRTKRRLLWVVVGALLVAFVGLDLLYLLDY